MTEPTDGFQRHVQFPAIPKQHGLVSPTASAAWSMVSETEKNGRPGTRARACKAGALPLPTSMDFCTPLLFVIWLTDRSMDSCGRQRRAAITFSVINQSLVTQSIRHVIREKRNAFYRKTLCWRTSFDELANWKLSGFHGGISRLLSSDWLVTTGALQRL